jgi:hypothetical protein
MSLYDVVLGQGTIKRSDWSINSAALTDDMKTGRWVYKDATGKATKTPASPATMANSVFRPIWSGKEKPDSEETNLVSTIFGEHEALSDGYNADPTALTPVRAAWAVNQAVVTINGELVPYLAGTDNEEAILGHVVELADSQGRIRFHIK